MRIEKYNGLQIDSPITKSEVLLGSPCTAIVYRQYGDYTGIKDPWYCVPG